MLTPSVVGRASRDDTHDGREARRDASWFAALREREFSRLDRAGETYLDYTGSALYAESHVHEHLAHLTDTVLGNPHSQSVASLRSTEAIEDTRRATLQFFAADPEEYEVIFTANASGALRLVAEAFPFGPASRLVLAADNHNSVNGIREIATLRGAELRYVELDDELRLCPVAPMLVARRGPSLFGYPAQSNFSGVQHPLRLVDEAHDAGYQVLLDAAAFVPTNPLRLDVIRPDFVTLSFYKMFGYPTGIGALVARRDALAQLRRPWFAGGTVEFVSVRHRTHMMRAGAEGFEDGTPNFTAIGAVRAGLDWLGSVGVPQIRRHVSELTDTLLAELAALRHPGGESAIRLYGPADTRARGATVAFNVVDQRGAIVPYQRVEARALEHGVSLRGGCFCNPGAAERAFGFPPSDTARCMERARREGFSVERFAECLGGDVPIGAVRASLGVASSVRDIERFTSVLATFC